MPSTTAAVAPQATPYLPTPRERQLLDLREQGLSLVAIAGKANVPESVVIQSFKRLRDRGVAVPESKAKSATRASQLAPARVDAPSTGRWVWTDGRRDDVRRLYAAGKTASQIAAEIGAPTRNAVIGIVHRLGLKRDVVPTKTVVARKPVAARAPAISPSRAPAPMKAAPKPPAEPIEALPATTRSEAAPPGAITIHELRDHRCHWPFGDPRDDDFRYCGAPVAAATRERGRFYCDGHMVVAGGAPAKGRGR